MGRFFVAGMTRHQVKEAYPGAYAIVAVTGGHMVFMDADALQIWKGQK